MTQSNRSTKKQERKTQFYPDLAARITALRLNNEYMNDRSTLDRAPLFFNDSPDDFVRANEIRARMAQAGIPSFGKWHIAEVVQVVRGRHRVDRNTIVLKSLRAERYLTLRINPCADKESILQAAWEKIKQYRRRGSNHKPVLSPAKLESDGSIVIEVDITTTHARFEPLFWAAIRSLRPSRALRSQRGHSNTPLDDIAVLRSIKKMNLHAQAKERCQTSTRSVEADDVDRTLQSLKRARDRAKRHVSEAYPRS